MRNSGSFFLSEIAAFHWVMISRLNECRGKLPSFQRLSEMPRLPIENPCPIEFGRKTTTLIAVYLAQCVKFP